MARVIVQGLGLDYGDVSLLEDVDVPEGLEGEIFDFIAAGVGRVGDLLAEYHRLSLDLSDSEPQQLARLERVQHER